MDVEYGLALLKFVIIIVIHTFTRSGRLYWCGGCFFSSLAIPISKIWFDAWQWMISDLMVRKRQRINMVCFSALNKWNMNRTVLDFRIHRCLRLHDYFHKCLCVDDCPINVVDRDHPDIQIHANFIRIYSFILWLKNWPFSKSYTETTNRVSPHRL